MGKHLYLAEKPSVAQEFAKALEEKFVRKDGYLESPNAVVTWCVGHLVTMSYPEAYGPQYRKWSLDTLPFLPEKFRYEVIGGVEKQYGIVSGLLHRADVDVIYVCTDSGREGEYIYRLVEMQAGVRGKERRRVWIDSQTKEEILRGIREAKDLSAYDDLGEAAFLRAKEDYLMGINFSRVLTLKYGNYLQKCLHGGRTAISVGRVMTCVLGMVVGREREIRSFVKTPFYRVMGEFSRAASPADESLQGTDAAACASPGEGASSGGAFFSAEWRALPGSHWFQAPSLYKENGFRKREDAQALAEELGFAGEEGDGRFLPDPGQGPLRAVVERCERKKERKQPPLPYNLAELQNDCSRLLHISPDETLRIAQELYEKKLTTYPRTDARVLSSAVAKEIGRNLAGLRGYGPAAPFCDQILQQGSYRQLTKSRYVDDSQITDHYAILPTGQGFSTLPSLSPVSQRVYQIIVRRFLRIFFPPAVYDRVSLTVLARSAALPQGERFCASFRALTEEGYLAVMPDSSEKPGGRGRGRSPAPETGEGKEGAEDVGGPYALEVLEGLRKGSVLFLGALQVREGETSPPKRYNSGSLILAMENAGQLIEEESLREMIRGSGIGTSATRAEILRKLIHIGYLSLQKRTQIVTPTLLGEAVRDVVACSIRPLLDPALTASWEKGLSGVAKGRISPREYMGKLTDFVGKRTEMVKDLQNQETLFAQFQAISRYYERP